MEKFSLPQREYVIPNPHAYSIGDRVRNINNAEWNKYYGQEGIITKLLPFGHLYPAYDVQYEDDKIVATSERSIERVIYEFECDVCSASCSTYITCGKCDWTLCIACRHDIEGIAYCRECYAECLKEGEDDGTL